MFGNFKPMLADIRILFSSDVYQAVRYKCNCNICSLSQPEYSDSFCIDFIQTGFFEYRSFRRQEEVHTGRILISKPGFPYTIRHVDNQPDTTTTFRFKPAFLQQLILNYAREAGWFLQNPDVHSIVINSNAALDHLHHLFLQQVSSLEKTGESIHHVAADKLYIDDLVLHLLDTIMHKLGNVAAVAPLPDALKLYHLPVIELAQDYLLQHFREDISLQQLAEHCHTSLFHFSRIFKAVLGVSPHQYLLGIRLHQAKRLLADTQQPVSEVAFACGFNSLEHFATAYRKKYNVSPSTYRRQLV